MTNRIRSARDLMNLRQQSAGREWFKILRNQSGGTEVHIYDEIGWFGLTAQDFIKQLSDISGPIDLHLNSPGGEVMDGIAIYNALAQRGSLTVVVDSLAASIASVIAMAADPGKLVMIKRSQMMIHDGFGMQIGNAADMREMADLLDKQSNNIAGIYADRTGKTQAYWRDEMRNEKWYTAEEAVDAGLADTVVDPRTGSTTNRAPAGRHVHAAATVPYVSPLQTRHEPTTITHTHDHAAMGADDGDDGIHSHEHTHGPGEHPADHDHTHEPGMGGEGTSGVEQMASARRRPGTRAAAKLSHEEANYRESTSDEQCGNCAMSSISGGVMHCSLVQDPIESDDVCDHYESKKSTSDAYRRHTRNVKKPHGDVPYADPGYLDEDGEQVSKSGKEGVARYPIDKEHVEAAWSYINQKKNADQYTAEQLASIKGKIKSAMKKFGHEVSEDASDFWETVFQNWDPEVIRAAFESAGKE